MRLVGLRAAGAAVLAAVLAACAATPLESRLALDGAQEIQLTGVLTRADHQTYREIPFTVPAGVQRVSVELTYEGRDQKTVVDLGLRDPHGFRGWSGGNKQRITVAEFDATPSYRAGPITPGIWTLVLGVPNIREGSSSAFNASVTFETAKHASDISSFSAAPIARGSAWRRGDFHTHTGHSDASCADSNGVRLPCPVIRTLEAAQKAGLDFVAVTDHNTISQNAALRELQLAFPGLLVIPGTEITTFFGHANALGVTAPLDFQLGSPRLPNLDVLLDQTEAQGAILSVNHPRQPSSEACMGCGWTVTDTDWTRIAAIEVVNGASLRLGGAEGPLSGLPFWEKLLEAGHRVTAIGGSDNHDPTSGAIQAPVGTPATVVWTDELSESGVLRGVQSGLVFVDVGNTPGSVLNVEVRSGGSVHRMGGTLELAGGAQADVFVTVSGVDGGRIEIVSGGLDVIEPAMLSADGPRASVSLTDGAAHGWVRVNVRGADGKLRLVGNAVYIVRPGSQTDRLATVDNLRGSR